MKGGEELDNVKFERVFLPIEYEIDESFDSDKYIKMRARILHDQINPNKSDFSIDVIEDAEDSLSNIPILANVIFDENTPDFGAHDMHLEEDRVNDGEYRLIYDEAPIGLVPETNNYTIEKFNGKNYVYTDIFLWRGYMNYAEDIVVRDKDIKLSVELIIDSYSYDNKTKIYKILKYRYKGITLLGKKYETGMENALASMSGNFEEKFNFISKEIGEEIAKNNSHNFIKEDDIETDNESKEVDVLDEKMKLVESFGLTIEDLDFSIEDIEIDELKQKLTDFSKPDGSGEALDNEKEPEKDFALVQQFIQELIEKLSVEKIQSEWDEGYSYSRYSYVDHNDESGEVYFWDRKDWRLYGAKYSKDGDSVVIDFESVKRKRFDIVDFDEGVSGEFSIDDVFSDVFEAFKTFKAEEISVMKNEFDEYKEAHKTPNEDVAVLEDFKAEKLAEERDSAIESVFSEFEEKLANVQEFVELKKNTAEMEIEDIKKECFAILGRQSFTFTKKKTAENKTPKLPVNTPSPDENLYGGIFAVYGKKAKK